jgi:hypothetical protein
MQALMDFIPNLQGFGPDDVDMRRSGSAMTNAHQARAASNCSLALRSCSESLHEVNVDGCWLL